MPYFVPKNRFFLKQKGMIPMKTSSSTSARTEGQEKNFRRLGEDTMKKAGDLALSKILKDKETMGRFLARGDEFCKAILDVTMSKARELSFAYGEQVSSWVLFYKKHFNLELDLSNLKIPDHQESFDRLIIVATGLMANQVYSACEKQFSCRRYWDNLDNLKQGNDRSSQNGTYLIWVRDRQEADEENKSQSYDQRREQGCQDENPLEHILHELKYFDETSEHLDINNWMLTSALYPDGHAVDAHWSDGKFRVGGWRSGSAHPNLRARSVVSCQPKPERA